MSQALEQELNTEIRKQLSMRAVLRLHYLTRSGDAFARVSARRKGGLIGHLSRYVRAGPTEFDPYQPLQAAVGLGLSYSSLRRGADRLLATSAMYAAWQALPQPVASIGFVASALCRNASRDTDGEVQRHWPPGVEAARRAHDIDAVLGEALLEMLIARDPFPNCRTVEVVMRNAARDLEALAEGASDDRGRSDTPGVEERALGYTRLRVDHEPLYGADHGVVIANVARAFQRSSLLGQLAESRASTVTTDDGGDRG